MPPTDLDRESPPGNRGRALATIAAGQACWFWAFVAVLAGIALLSVVVIDRAGLDDVSQPLLFRLIVMAWNTLGARGPTRMPGLDDGRLLSYYHNRDFADAYLIGLALAAFGFAAVLGITARGVERGDRRDFRIVVGLSTLAAMAIMAYAWWCFIRGASAADVSLVALCAAISAALAFAASRGLFRPEPSEPRSTRRPNPLIRPALLVILSFQAALVVPWFAWAWVSLGIQTRRIWLAWVS